jgi:hypothetical protein
MPGYRRVGREPADARSLRAASHPGCVGRQTRPRRATGGQTGSLKLLASQCPMAPSGRGSRRCCRRASCRGPFDEPIRVICEDLDPHGPDPGDGRTFQSWSRRRPGHHGHGPCDGRASPAVALGFAHENRSVGDAQPGDAAEVPQFRRPKGALAPADRGRRVLDREHERHMHFRCHRRPSRSSRPSRFSRPFQAFQAFQVL